MRRRTTILGGAALLVLSAAALRVAADCASYGLPFTDLGSESTFCAAIAEAYFTGLTNGTTATTYSPSKTVTRDQMAAFVTRTLDQSLLRGSRRAAIDQWWTQAPQYDKSLGLTDVGANPSLLKSDGLDVWVVGGNGLTRVRTSDGKSLQTWSVGFTTGSTTAVLIAMGKVFTPTIGDTGDGILYMIDPSTAPGDPNSIIDVASVPNGAIGIAFDGARIWVASQLKGVSIVTPAASTPWSVTTVKTGLTEAIGPIFDGSNVWVTDIAADKLVKLDSNATVLQSVAVGNSPEYPAFDGRNIWVPNHDDSSLTVVRASDGAVLKTFSAGNGDQNGLDGPISAAFDGQRILVANLGGGLSLFRASDLTAIAHWTTSGVSAPFGVCSDGANFWVSFEGSDKLGRF